MTMVVELCANSARFDLISALIVHLARIRAGEGWRGLQIPIFSAFLFVFFLFFCKFENRSMHKRKSMGKVSKVENRTIRYSSHCLK